MQSGRHVGALVGLLTLNKAPIGAVGGLTPKLKYEL